VPIWPGQLYIADRQGLYQPATPSVTWLESIHQSDALPKMSDLRLVAGAIGMPGGSRPYM
jgi:hypothetical protein